MIELGSTNNAVLFPKYDSTQEGLVFQILIELGGNPAHFAFTAFQSDNPTMLPPYRSNYDALLYEWLSIIKNQCFSGIDPAA